MIFLTSFNKNILRKIKVKSDLVIDISEPFGGQRYGSAMCVWGVCVCTCTSLKLFDDIEKDTILVKVSPQTVQLW